MPEVREVLFLDTGDFHLYNNAFILRRRISYEDGFPVGDPEIVFKYRSPDMMIAQSTDVRPRISGNYKIKFKIELLPLKERIGGVRRLLAHNVEFGLSQAPEADRLAMSSLDNMSLPELQHLFPPLELISCDGPSDVALVNQCIVEELMQDICELDFGHRARAMANVALWRSRGDHRAFVGEFAYQLRFNGPDRHQPQGAACLRALLHRVAADGRRLAVAHRHQDRRGLSVEGQPTTGARMNEASSPTELPAGAPAVAGQDLLGSSWSWAPPALGGGVVGYLRTGLVVRNNWLDDVTFVELLSISQTLPGLNATNMSILVGDRLRGAWGAVLATVGMCLPGAMLMTAAAYAYGIGGDDPWSKAFLHGIAAGALGLIVVVMVQLRSAGAEGSRRLRHRPGDGRRRRRCSTCRCPTP